MAYMCEEMVIKILARLPVKSLVRFMAVCRLWKTIISSPDFSRLEFSKPKLLVHTARECYSLVENDNNNNNNRRLMLETYFPPFKQQYCSHYDRAVVIGSDNGLVCIGIIKLSIHKDYFFRVIIWNPSIRRHVVIPHNHPLLDHNIDYGFEYACGFGGTASGRDYKYVRVVGAYDGKCNLRRAVDVYSLKAGAWGPRKYLDWDFTHGLSSSYLNSALLRGRLHWIGGRRSRSDQILAFDLEDEAFDDDDDKTMMMMMLPTEAQEAPSSCLRITSPASVFVIRESQQQQLAVITNEKGDQYSAVWVMQEYGNVHSWVKLFAIDLTVENIYTGFGPTMLHFFKDGSGELLLGLSRMKRVLVTYNPDTMHTHEDHDLIGGLVLHRLCGFTNFYRESLVLLADHHPGAVADHLSIINY